MKTRHKKTCAVCGWPRLSTTHTEEQQCEQHCPGCRQPMPFGAACPWCCSLCDHHPCICEPDVQIYDSDDEDSDGCSDEDCDECHPNGGEQGEKVLPPGKVWTGKGKSGYATGSLQPPWETAGIKNFPFHSAEGLYESAAEAWPDMRCDEVDPVQRAADFYLLSAITSGCLNGQTGPDGSTPNTALALIQKWYPELTGARLEAQQRLDELVDDTDRSFKAYIDMACGGELRHHGKVCGKHLNASRSLAWIAWRSLREVRGPEALMDAYWLFNDFTQGGYGGPLWAGAAELLYKRITGKISKTVFVDQTFSLVHNGGVFLNKQHWNIKSGKDLSYLQKYLLPAQSRDNWQVMCDVASPSTRRLWREGWMELNQCRRKANARPTPIPGLENRTIRKCGFCGMNPSLGHRNWVCRDGSRVERQDREYGRGSGYNYPYPSWDADGKVLKLYEGKYYSLYTSQRSPILRNYGNNLEDVLTHEWEWKGLSRLIFNDQTIFEFTIPASAKWTIQDMLDLHGIRVEMIPNLNPEPDQDLVVALPTGEDDEWWLDDDETELAF